MEKQSPRTRMTIDNADADNLSVKLEIEHASGDLMVFQFRPPMIPGEGIAQLQQRMLKAAVVRIRAILDDQTTA